MQFTLFLILLICVFVVGVIIMTILVYLHDNIIKIIAKLKTLFKKKDKNV